MHYLLGIGSNLGDRVQNIVSSIDALTSAGHKLIRQSSLYESMALLKNDSPESWWAPYLNACIIISSEMDAMQMLIYIKYIEQKIGRNLADPTWSPRIIDIDILMEHSGFIVNSAVLTIPHPDMLLRDFVLMPAIEIASDWVHPIAMVRLSEHEAIINTECRRYEN